MELWISCIIFLFALIGIVLLAVKMKRIERKTAYIAAITALTVVAIAMLCYAVLTLCMVGGVA